MTLDVGGGVVEIRGDRPDVTPRPVIVEPFLGRLDCVMRGL
ncbi:MAG TPA: hypothetical protein VFZ79_14960 [Acidimicrobiales bacterium]